jgi:hypothetical protein
MYRIVSHALFALLVSAAPVLAQFEGVLEMRTSMTTSDGEGPGGGTMKIAVGKPGARIELNTKAGPMSINTVMLVKNDMPNVLYRIDDARKTYTEVDVTKAQAMANMKQDSATYSVEKLGEEKIMGYATQHVVVKEKNPAKASGMTTEMWIAKGFADYELLSKVRGKAGGDKGMAKALKDAGAEGLPLKSIHTTSDGASIKTEVVKIEKQSLPSSTFEIPAGYTKTEGGMMGMMGGVSGQGSEEANKKMSEAQQKMQEALKNMSPEQREMVEKMMKQRQAPNQ